MLKRLHGSTRTRFAVNVTLPIAIPLKQTKLEPRGLHYWTHYLANFYFQTFNLKFPSITLPPILWNYIQAMSLPMEIYHIAMELTHLLDLTEFYLAGDFKWQKTGGNPESKIMALIVIACKLSYDLENSTAWKDWAEATSEELRKISQLNMDDVRQEDILTMSDEKLDEYMDWLQETWIEDDQEPDIFSGIPFVFKINVSETTYPRVHSHDVSLGEDTDIRRPGSAEDDR